MNAETVKWSLRYQTALRKYLKQGPEATLRPVCGLGRKAVELGLETLDVARIHGQSMTSLASEEGSSMTRQRMIVRAKNFFTETIVPIEKTHRAALNANIRINQLTRTLHRRIDESSVSIRRLKQSILLRQGAEKTLKRNGKQHARLLTESHRLQKQLRDLTHTLILARENKRQKMSICLHDEIAQILIAIDFRLLSLKNAASISTVSLKKEIDDTQQMMKESVIKISSFTHKFDIQHET